jgi:hypothetical protein
MMLMNADVTFHHLFDLSARIRAIRGSRLHCFQFAKLRGTKANS